MDTLFLEFQAALIGRYSLERELGRGGMGVVYLAREVALERLVAIKLLPPELAAQRPLRERFLREARTAAQLSQPNIVPIHAVDEVKGYVFFVMAYIDGETLGERIRSRGPLAPSEAGRILREIAWALAYAHGQGVIHRDLKPDNIILERSTGRAILTDFGIARRVEAGGLTEGGELIGTPEFMSPEQATGEALDGRADLYSLGMVGYYALSGRIPFDATTVSGLLVAQASEPVAPLTRFAPETPRALAQGVMRCLEKRPEHRFPDAKGFADALSLALESRREVPAPVRAFVKNSLEVKGGGCLYLVAVFYLGPTVFLGLLLPFRIFSAGMMFFSYFGYLLVTLVLVPILGHISRVRKLVRAGYGVEDVLAGVRVDNEQRREEMTATLGREPSGLEKGLAGSRWIGLATALGTTVLLTAGIMTRFFIPQLSSLVVLGLALWIMGMIAYRRRRDVIGDRRLKYWGSKFGRWVFKIAARGLKGRAPGAGATHRPTELALAFAAEDLYAELPKEVRAALPELPQVLSRLEQQARTVRARVEQLEQSLADVALDPSGGAAAERREKLLAELTKARDMARARLGETVAALETIRLDLLRLRAGMGSVDRITADLSAAGAIGESVDRLLAAGDEIDRDLDKP